MLFFMCCCDMRNIRKYSDLLFWCQPINIKIEFPHSGKQFLPSLDPRVSPNNSAIYAHKGSDVQQQKIGINSSFLLFWDSCCLEQLLLHTLFVVC